MQDKVPSLLLIDDSLQLYFVIKEISQKLSVSLTCARTIMHARTCIHAKMYDCILLDYVLPDGFGTELLEEISICSQESRVLMLTRLCDVSHRIEGLQMGADDYLSKPFNVTELMLRIQSLLKKRKCIDLKTYTSNGICVKDESCICEYNGKILKLRKKEYILFQFMLRHIGQLLKRETLYAHIWTLDKYPTSSALDICISRLRQALLGTGIIIETGYKVGYRLVIHGTNKTSHISSTLRSGIEEKV